jgi:hypothetical protein
LFRETIDHLQLALSPRNERFDLDAEFRKRVSDGHIAQKCESGSAGFHIILRDRFSVLHEGDLELVGVGVPRLAG